MKKKTFVATIVLAVLVFLNGCALLNSPPVASFIRSPSSGPYPLTVSFNAAASRDSDGTIVSYEWSFGDGESNTRVTTAHTYQTSGTYTAVLRITDNDGSTDTASRSITVTQPYTPPPSPDPSVAYSVTAGQLLDEYDTNEVAATLKYKDKVIAVSGYVDSVNISISGEPYVNLIRSPGIWTLRTVSCYFPMSAMSSVAGLSEGDSVTIIGTCKYYMLLSVILYDCRF